MRRVLPVSLFALAVAATWTLSLVRAEDKKDEKPKYTIKQVMQMGILKIQLAIDLIVFLVKSSTGNKDANIHK